jgi:hypothetical protein
LLVGREGDLKIDRVVGVSLLKLLKGNKSLKYLDLVDIDIDSDGLKSLVDGLRAAKSLKVLGLPLVDSEELKTIFSVLNEDGNTVEELENVLCTEEEDMDQFLSFLAGSRLKRVQFHHQCCEFTDKLSAKLLDIVKTNRNLQHIESYGPTVDPYGRLNFFLQLNRAGRRLLKGSQSSPPSVLPHLLSRMSGPNEVKSLYYFVSEIKDQIFAATAGRKRRRPPSRTKTSRKKASR